MENFDPKATIEPAMDKIKKPGAGETKEFDWENGQIPCEVVSNPGLKEIIARRRNEIIRKEGFGNRALNEEERKMLFSGDLARAVSARLDEKGDFSYQNADGINRLAEIFNEVEKYILIKARELPGMDLSNPLNDFYKTGSNEYGGVNKYVVVDAMADCGNIGILKWLVDASKKTEHADKSLIEFIKGKISSVEGDKQSIVQVAQDKIGSIKKRLGL